MTLQQISPILRIIFLSSFILLGATACGGGGGGGGGGGSSGSTTTTTSSWISSISTAQADVYRTTEYDAQNGLESSVNSAKAYALLAANSLSVAGDGITIGIIDTGAQTDHDEIAGNLSATGNYDYYDLDSDVSDGDGHGTHVASIAAGVKDGSGMHGVAYNSKLMIGKVFSDAGTGATTTIAANAVRGLSDNGVKVINLSLGSAYSDGGSATLRNAIAYAKSKDVLVVAATGNVAATQPDYPASHATHIDVIGYEIAVGALNSAQNGIASYSNYCGDVQEYCLVAPGTSIYAAMPVGSVIQTDPDYGCDASGYCAISGTSMATPHVAGAAAVIRGAWPHLSASQTAQILLTTATDMGDAGTDAIYGRGALNLNAAVQAQGADELSYGSSVLSGGYSVSSTSIILDPMFGDSFSSKVIPKLKNAVYFDDYGRDYKADLGSRISQKTSANVPSLDGIAFNNFDTKNIPLSFGKDQSSKFTFQYRSYQNSFSDLGSEQEMNVYNKNRFGLKFLTIDNSKEDILANGSGGFSFVQNMSRTLKVGFAFNSDEISNLRQGKASNLGFISIDDFSGNPYQRFVSGSVISSFDNQRNFNQLFVSKSLFSKKMVLSFSNQISYETPTIASAINNRQNQTSDLHLSFLPNQESNFSISLGNLDEFDNNFLNSKSLGAFETSGDVKTSYFKISATKKLFKNLYLISSFSEGITKAKGNDLGIFRNYSDIRSRSSAMGLTQNSIFGGKLGLIYSQPLRVYKGSASINIPVARDLDGNVTRYSSEVSLKPDGKEQDLEFFYSKDLTEESRMKLNLIIQKEPGNIKDSPNNYLGFMSYSKKF